MLYKHLLVLLSRQLKRIDLVVQWEGRPRSGPKEPDQPPGGTAGCAQERGALQQAAIVDVDVWTKSDMPVWRKARAFE